MKIHHKPKRVKVVNSKTYIYTYIYIPIFVQKTLITNKCTKSFFIDCDTFLHVSTLLGHLQGELSVVVTLRLHFTLPCKAGPQSVHASKNNAVHSQQHVLAQLQSATLV
jgi:hypothetical protein